MLRAAKLVAPIVLLAAVAGAQYSGGNPNLYQCTNSPGCWGPSNGAPHPDEYYVKGDVLQAYDNPADQYPDEGWVPYDEAHVPAPPKPPAYDPNDGTIDLDNWYGSGTHFIVTETRYAFDPDGMGPLPPILVVEYTYQAVDVPPPTRKLERIRRPLPRRGRY